MNKAPPKRSRPKSNDCDYQVGYGRPPKSGQFKPGNKAFLKRKNKKSKTAGAQFARLMGERVSTTTLEIKRYHSRLQLFVDNTVVAACRGEIRAAADLLSMHSTSKPVGNMRRRILVFEAGDAEL